MTLTNKPSFKELVSKIEVPITTYENLVTYNIFHEKCHIEQHIHKPFQYIKSSPHQELFKILEKQWQDIEAFEDLQRFITIMLGSKILQHHTFTLQNGIKQRRLMLHPQLIIDKDGKLVDDHNDYSRDTKHHVQPHNVCNKTDLIYIPEKPLMSVYRKYL
jgi:hypothetical protein